MADSILRKRITYVPLETRSLYSFCANIKKSGNYSKTISGIAYDIEAIKVNTIDDSNISAIFSDISNDESKFLLLKAKNINISGTLTPPYPKKSLIIFCSNIEGTGTISMTGKGPNTLPEDILLFDTDEVAEAGRVLIPAYANNSKVVVEEYAISLQTAISRYKGSNGTGYNCGGGGAGGSFVNSASSYPKTNVTTSSGYSYGGGAGGGGYSGHNTNFNSINSTYPMRGGNGVSTMGTSASGGIGNPNGTYVIGNGYNFTSNSSFNTVKGVGGRLIIFCNSCTISNLKAQGVSYLPFHVTATGDGGTQSIGGSSGGGSINIFYIDSLTSTCNVSGGSYAYCEGGTSNAKYRHTGGAGGDGTVVSIQCSNIRYK